MSNKIKVLIIDDSAVVRATLTQIFNSDPDLDVIGAVADPFLAADKISKEVPDVITLDIEMPKMDGLTFLKKLMSQHPIPVIVLSTLTASGSDTALKALELGALEVLEKPKINTKASLEESTALYCELVKNAAKAKVRKAKAFEVSPKLTADAVILKKSNTHLTTTTDKIIAVGASTGGTEALKDFLLEIPVDSPGILIVQHMPEMFTKQFAQRLNGICDIVVKEAENGESVLKGHAYIAPGNKHLILKRSGARYYIETKDGPLVSRHRPSVDVLFRSVATYAGQNAIGVILTGMGDDGARGMKEMKDSGSYNIAQDENSCVVFGMPNEAIKHGGVDIVAPLSKISKIIFDILKKQLK